MRRTTSGTALPCARCWAAPLRRRARRPRRASCAWAPPDWRGRCLGEPLPLLGGAPGLGAPLRLWCCCWPWCYRCREPAVPADQPAHPRLPPCRRCHPAAPPRLHSPRARSRRRGLRAMQLRAFSTAAARSSSAMRWLPTMPWWVRGWVGGRLCGGAEPAGRRRCLPSSSGAARQPAGAVHGHRRRPVLPGVPRHAHYGAAALRGLRQASGRRAPALLAVLVRAWGGGVHGEAVRGGGGSRVGRAV